MKERSSKTAATQDQSELLRDTHKATVVACMGTLVALVSLNVFFPLGSWMGFSVLGWPLFFFSSFSPSPSVWRVVLGVLIDIGICFSILVAVFFVLEAVCWRKSLRLGVIPLLFFAGGIGVLLFLNLRADDFYATLMDPDGGRARIRLCQWGWPMAWRSIRADWGFSDSGSGVRLFGAISNLVVGVSLSFAGALVVKRLCVFCRGRFSHRIHQALDQEDGV